MTEVLQTDRINILEYIPMEASNTGVTKTNYCWRPNSNFREDSMRQAILNKKSLRHNSVPSLAYSANLDSVLADNMTPLHEIIRQRKLSAMFQPILNLRTGKFYGYEGLIRGPGNSTLHSPINLFDAAAQQNLTLEVEMLRDRKSVV